MQTNAQQKAESQRKAKTAISSDYTSEDTFPDTLTKFNGIIKYRMTGDDPSEKDSMFIIFGEPYTLLTCLSGYMKM